ncbi:MAG: hypothetical protein U0401_26405 [Anaerolineae bacterium]
MPADYPRPKADVPNALHQVDFVSRRIRGSGERFYGCHLLDLARHWPYLRIITTKSAKQVAQFLVSAWQQVGVPTAVQIDNDIVWNGGGRGQRGLSTIVRLCLAVGVEVIFIPPYTPKANGSIEILTTCGTPTSGDGPSSAMWPMFKGTPLLPEPTVVIVVPCLSWRVEC